MCRRNHCWGLMLVAFGLGLLIGQCLESGFWCASGSIVIIGVVVPIVAAFLGSKKPTASNWMIWSCVGLVCALIGAICIRVLFFQMGASVFIFY